MAKNARANQLKELIDKEVWFRTTLNDFNSGILKFVEGGDHAAILLLTVDGKEQHGWRHVHANDIYLTKEDLCGANYEKFQARVKNYCDLITDVGDLVRFCYTHRVADCGEETDFAAQAAVRTRTKELLGFEVDPEAAKVEKKLENGESILDAYWKKSR